MDRELTKTPRETGFARCRRFRSNKAKILLRTDPVLVEHLPATEEVIALVINNNKGGKVFDLDLPHCLHP